MYLQKQGKHQVYVVLIFWSLLLFLSANQDIYAACFDFTKDVAAIRQHSMNQGQTGLGTQVVVPCVGNRFVTVWQEFVQTDEVSCSASLKLYDTTLYAGIRYADGTRSKVTTIQSGFKTGTCHSWGYHAASCLVNDISKVMVVWCEYICEGIDPYENFEGCDYKVKACILDIDPANGIVKGAVQDICVASSGGTIRLCNVAVANSGDYFLIIWERLTAGMIASYLSTDALQGAIVSISDPSLFQTIEFNHDDLYAPQSHEPYTVYGMVPDNDTSKWFVAWSVKTDPTTTPVDDKRGELIGSLVSYDGSATDVGSPFTVASPEDTSASYPNVPNKTEIYQYCTSPAITGNGTNLFIVWRSRASSCSHIIGRMFVDGIAGRYIEISPVDRYITDYDQNATPRASTDGNSYFVIWKTAGKGTLGARFSAEGEFLPDGTTPGCLVRLSTYSYNGIVQAYCVVPYGIQGKYLCFTTESWDGFDFGDLDEDNVVNGIDPCPLTPVGALPLASDGCLLDEDKDGIADAFEGCATSSQDDDMDGVPNGCDSCLDSDPGTGIVDVSGCLYAALPSADPYVGHVEQTYHHQWQPPLLDWVPGWSSGVNPANGNGGDTFSFKVTYTSPMGLEPITSDVWVDLNGNGICELEESFVMEHDLSGDGDYKNGEDYSVDVKLFYDGVSPVNYRFFFQDLGGSQAEGPGAGQNVLAINQIGSCPVLGLPQGVSSAVNPNVAQAGTPTDFTFHVTYTDNDNDLPAAARVCLNSGECYDMKWIQGTNGYTTTVALEYDIPDAAKYWFDFNDGHNKAQGHLDGCVYIVFGGEQIISREYRDESAPCIVDISGNSTVMDAHYMILWQAAGSDAINHIWCRLLDTQGVPVTDAARVDTSTVGAFKPQAVYDSLCNHVFAVWEDTRNATLDTDFGNDPDDPDDFRLEGRWKGVDIFGAMINFTIYNGKPAIFVHYETALAGNDLNKESPYNQVNPSVILLPAETRYCPSVTYERMLVLVWEDETGLYDGSGTKTDILCRRIGCDAQVYGLVPFATKSLALMRDVNGSSAVSPYYDLLPRVADVGPDYLVFVWQESEDPLDGPHRIWCTRRTMALDYVYESDDICGWELFADHQGCCAPGIASDGTNCLAVCESENEILGTFLAHGSDIITYEAPNGTVVTKPYPLCGLDKDWNLTIAVAGTDPVSGEIKRCLKELPWAVYPLSVIGTNNFRAKVMWHEEANEYVVSWINKPSGGEYGGMRILQIPRLGLNSGYLLVSGAVTSSSIYSQGSYSLCFGSQLVASCMAAWEDDRITSCSLTDGSDIMTSLYRLVPSIVWPPDTRDSYGLVYEDTDLDGSFDHAAFEFTYTGDRNDLAETQIWIGDEKINMNYDSTSNRYTHILELSGYNTGWTSTYRPFFQTKNGEEVMFPGSYRVYFTGHPSPSLGGGKVAQGAVRFDEPPRFSVEFTHVLDDPQHEPTIKEIWIDTDCNGSYSQNERFVLEIFSGTRTVDFPLVVTTYALSGYFLPRAESTSFGYKFHLEYQPDPSKPAQILETGEQAFEFIPEGIRLYEGWNLISFRTNICLHDDEFDPQGVLLPEGVEMVNVSNLKYATVSDWFKGELVDPSTGDPLWIRTTGFDMSGSLLADKNLPASANTLHYFCPGYGYWMKVDKDVDLILYGYSIPLDTKIVLNEGWNLVGYVSDSVNYTVYYQAFPPEEAFSGIRPPVDYEAGVPTFKELIDTVSGKMFRMDNGYKVRRVLGFDNYGIGSRIYDVYLPAFINTLKYMGPGYGYWVKIEHGSGQTSYLW